MMHPICEIAGSGITRWSSQHSALEQFQPPSLYLVTGKPPWQTVFIDHDRAFHPCIPLLQTV